MDYRFLGKTGKKVSILSLGCSNFGERTTEEEAEKIILKAVENGINFFDTANVYPNQGLEGKSESIIGKILKKHNLRDKIFLATKVRARMSNKDFGLSKNQILKQNKASLVRFQVDKIDLYQFHRPDNTTSVEEQLSAISELVGKKKISFFGLSEFKTWQIVEFLWQAQVRNFPSCVSMQANYNLFDRSIETDVISIAKKFGISILAYSPLDGGFLTGKYRLNKPMPKDGRHTIWNKNFESEDNQLKLKKIEKLLKIAESKNISLIQLSIAWVLQNKNITSCIIGPRTLKQLDEYILALNVTLSNKELKEIDLICLPPKTWIPSSKSMFR